MARGWRRGPTPTLWCGPIRCTLVLALLLLGLAPPSPLLAQARDWAQRDARGWAPSDLAPLCPHAPLDADALLADEAKLQRGMDREQPRKQDLEALTCDRLMLVLHRLPSRPGYRLSLGQSWFSGARALYQSIDAPSGTITQAMAIVAQEVGRTLGGAARGRGYDRREAIEFVLPGLYSLNAGSLVAAESRRSCVNVALSTGDRITAHECARLAMTAGTDSTWHALRLAYIAAIDRDTVSTKHWFDIGALAVKTLEDAGEFLWHLEPRQRGIPLEPSTAGRLPPDTDSTFLAMDASHRLDWVHARLAELARLVPPRLPADFAWVTDDVRLKAGRDFLPSSPDAWPSHIVLHFQRIGYAGGEFRECLLFTDGRPCWVLQTERDQRIESVGQLLRSSPPRLDQRGAAWIFAFPLSQPALGWSPGGTGQLRTVVSCMTRDGRWHQHEVVQRYRLPDKVEGNSLITGKLDLPCAEEVNAWAVTFASAFGRGGAYQDNVERFPEPHFLGSDLILGDPQQHVVLALDDTTLSTAPTGAIRRDSPLAVAALLAPDAPLPLRAELRVARTDPRTGRETVAVAVTDSITRLPDRSLWQRELLLSKVEPGLYTIVLTVGAGGLTDSRSAQLRIF